VIGVGYGTVGAVLVGRIDGGWDLGLLLGVKLLLTVICLGVIGVGGTFAPSLYLGAVLGALVGLIAHALFPGTPAAAFALVGMGGVLTAVVRAPITSVLLIFEITNDYHIILPIMLCVAISNLVANRLFKESVYTERLARHGIRLRSGRDQSVLEAVLVEEGMSTAFETVEPECSISQTLERMTLRRLHGIAVVDHGELVGIVTTSDIARALEENVDPAGPVGTIATTDILVAYTDQNLHDAIPLFALRDVRQVPVVTRNEPRVIVGMLRRADIVRSYSAGIVRRAERAHSDEAGLRAEGE
jgi:CIC family chloride channel protein